METIKIINKYLLGKIAETKKCINDLAIEAISLKLSDLERKQLNTARDYYDGKLMALRQVQDEIGL